MKDNRTKGVLYIVATPIGNLEDITLRAMRVLSEVDIIAAEDTRETLKLLNHLKIQKPLTSYYEHNKSKKGNYLIQQLLEGKKIAVVSDAGTPGISDPGEDLIKEAVNNAIDIIMVPGASAVIMGVVLSGFSSGRFVFEGFIPVNKRARKERLQELKNENRTMVFYEAPHKLLRTLEDMLEVFGDRNIALARELTKKYEEVIRCTLSEAVVKYTDDKPRGEYVLVVEGRSGEEIKATESAKWNDMSVKKHVDMYIKAGMTKKEAIKKAAEDRGVSKKEVYSQCLANKKPPFGGII